MVCDQRPRIDVLCLIVLSGIDTLTKSINRVVIVRLVIAATANTSLEARIGPHAKGVTHLWLLQWATR